MFKKLAAQIGWFVIVGCAAAATHWAVAVACVSLGGLPPLAANVVGWLVAFGVSFAGHYHLTFRHQRAPLGRAAARFFLVSALGFAVNEAAYAALLRLTAIRYDVLLALVLVGIAGMTFILGRYWAFRRSH
ncbi:GtrA family protein [Castellaniella defragrans]|jgi:putative flippase GtrA|uniref:GtrA-like protein n=2 Tax=Castellaniella defragrans TaxID=75697 RepID=W8X5F3_CASD6|nr:GtrA family protein [Castellaniella defragrans]KAB0624161.1 GtrA family protein [Castellaniella defragrans]MBB6082652.1 putative flippase GtrA [Castellaniella defragrans]CDM25582.1 GtrA-like protein [Castellaniella defragrans 65Phen]